MGFILFSSILAWSVVMLKGSTVYGRHPVSMAYMFTPLCGGEGGNHYDIITDTNSIHIPHAYIHTCIHRHTHSHAPYVHFWSIFLVSQQLGSSVGWRPTLCAAVDHLALFPLNKLLITETKVWNCGRDLTTIFFLLLTSKHRHDCIALRLEFYYLPIILTSMLPSSSRFSTFRSLRCACVCVQF